MMSLVCLFPYGGKGYLVLSSTGWDNNSDSVPLLYQKKDKVLGCVLLLCNVNLSTDNCLSLRIKTKQ